MFYVPSTYVLRPINICSTSHQHIFYASSTYLLRLIYVTSTRDRRLIYEGSTSHLRGTLKRNESMFHLSPNQVLLAAIYLRSPCHLLAISLRNPGLTFRQASVGTLFALRDVERPLRLSKSYLFTYYLLLSCLTTSETSVNIIINNIY
jgi:hypothetical protein